jgi:hypothetical protein
MGAVAGVGAGVAMVLACGNGVSAARGDIIFFFYEEDLTVFTSIPIR